MSEDDIDALLSQIIDFVEEEDLPHDWPDDNALFNRFKEMLYTWGDPFYTKERNYN
jgi:hypothetical protein